jgi:hypothetical protein
MKTFAPKLLALFIVAWVMPLLAVAAIRIRDMKQHEDSHAIHQLRKAELRKDLDEIEKHSATISAKLIVLEARCAALESKRTTAKIACR